MSTYNLKESLVRFQKGDSKHLTKLQIKKAQFLFENDYFIWNEAEMYLRYHEIFSSIPDSDVLYESLCKTTRIVFKLIHDIHYADSESNVAYLKFHEVLDAWAGLALYLKTYDQFPSQFVRWFESIFMIYQSQDMAGKRVVLVDYFIKLYVNSGLGKEAALDAFFKITTDNHYKLTLDYILSMIKTIILSNDANDACHLLIPNLYDTLKAKNVELKPPDQVFRNYDFNKEPMPYENMENKLQYKGGEFFANPTKPFYLSATQISLENTRSPALPAAHSHAAPAKSHPKSPVPLAANSSSSHSSTTPNTDLFLNEIYEELQREKQQTPPKPLLRTLNLTSNRPPDPAVTRSSYNEHTHSSQRMPEIDKLLSKLSKSSDMSSLQQPLNSAESKPATTSTPTPATGESQWQSSTSSNNFKTISGFRLADFRREFKRSVNDLNKNLSKSINALDYMTKSMDLTSTTDDSNVANDVGQRWKLPISHADRFLTPTNTNSSSDMRPKTMDESLLRKSIKNGVLTGEIESPGIKVVHASLDEVPIKDALGSSFHNEYENVGSRSDSSYSSDNPDVGQGDSKKYQSENFFQSESSKDSGNGLDAKLLRREEFNETYDTNLAEDSITPLRQEKKNGSVLGNSSQNTTNSTSSLSNVSIKKVAVGSSKVGLCIQAPISPKLHRMTIRELEDEPKNSSGQLAASKAGDYPALAARYGGIDQLDSAIQSLNSERLYKSSLKKKSKYENECESVQREFKTRGISASTPKPLESSVYRNKSPHSYGNMSFRNSSYEPKTFPNISKVGKQHKASHMLSHKSSNSHVKQRSGNTVRYDSSGKRFYVEDKNKSANGLSEKSRFKEDSLSSLDTLNDIDTTENINIQNIDEDSLHDHSSLSDYNCENYSRYENERSNKGIEQEWSYSLNNSVYFSQNDQRLMNEIVRRLKPIIKKTVKKQLKYYMEKQMLKELKKSGFMLNSFDSAENYFETLNGFC